MKKHYWKKSSVKAFGRWDWYYCAACDKGDYHNLGRHKKGRRS